MNKFVLIPHEEYTRFKEYLLNKEQVNDNENMNKGNNFNYLSKSEIPDKIEDNNENYTHPSDKDMPLDIKADLVAEKTLDKNKALPPPGFPMQKKKKQSSHINSSN